MFAAGVMIFAASAAQADSAGIAEIQAALDSWLAARSSAEMVTGVAAYISFGDNGPAIEAFAGKVGNGSQDVPVRQGTLFQIGSTSKSFTAALILKLEAGGKLSIDDTLGKWLPQYPAWEDVTIKRLLNMTSGIPNYSETEAMSRIWVNEPARDLTAENLIELVNPIGKDNLSQNSGYHYSNTNYILAGMVAAKAAGHSYRDLVHEMIIQAFGLRDTFYESGTYPDAVTERLAHGFFNNPACAEYQPKCTESWNHGLMGRDVRGMSTSWAQAAGGAIADARDVDRWMRAVFGGYVVPPKQQSEWMDLVSIRTGQPIADVTTDDPRGFSLGLGKAILGSFGAHWFYQGETLGYRTLYVWFEKENLMITLQTNSQPAAEADKLHDLIGVIYSIIQDKAK
ncbi:serine hydrolase domain-containing protein [Bradyrhizobium sp.]|uniref:serine hydrolase domain-containing protein n=1 Tax=Bradyrhizobium sp. TaxID=376 RepID=UPI003C17C200